KFSKTFFVLQNQACLSFWSTKKGLWRSRKDFLLAGFLFGISGVMHLDTILLITIAKSLDVTTILFWVLHY
ncbi:MAG: hypothetical protein KJO41_02895, partial [Bacteroidia bacterium]|nr:hypothetical protein [Bacteroidia bacterium]